MANQDKILYSQLESEFDDLGKDGIVDDFLDSARDHLMTANGFDQPVVYVNFAHGDEGPAAWYGARNMERLGGLKRIWDPKGLFGFYNTIPLNEPTGEEDEL